jgi:DNA transformation protein and related proteins
MTPAAALDEQIKQYPQMTGDSFKAFVLDQLSSLPEVRAKAMFGAYGLYQADRFFGILDEGRLFFKVNETTKVAYIGRGMGPFTYESRGKTLTMGYYEVPLEILEKAPDLVEWARQAIQIAAGATRKPVKNAK